MSRRVRFAAALCIAAVSAVLLAARGVPATPVDSGSNGLVVHEWGTFTSVAGADGQAVSWYPLSGGSDLPCFVRMLNPNGIKALVSGLPAVRATVRMETPVIYFYAEQETTARVFVRFPQGLISEWYPAATVEPVFLPADAADATGTIHWPRVTIRPGPDPAFPREPGDSHYYPARETDASPVVVDGQAEKFLFYRGLAGFPVTVQARVDADGRIALTNTGSHPLERLILFQNIDGRMGYRVLPALEGETTVEMPELTADFESLAAGLTQMLVAEGLYRREARAMVETWRDSWFEEGTRLMYLVPRADVDRILPLTVSPAPDQVVRTFVGRVEIITPAMQDEVEQALLRNDLATLNRCGRLLQPIVDSIRSRPALAGRQDDIDSLLRLIAASSTPENLCPAPAGR